MYEYVGTVPQALRMLPSDRRGGGGGGYIPYISNSHAIRQEIQRFESVHPSIYAIYDLIDLVPDPHLAQQIREHVVCIEGTCRARAQIIFIPIIYKDQYWRTFCTGGGGKSKQ